MRYVEPDDHVPTLPLGMATLFGAAVTGMLLGALCYTLSKPVPDTEELWLAILLGGLASAGLSLFAGVPIALALLTDRGASWWRWLGAGVAGGAIATVLLFLPYGGILLGITQDERALLLLLPAVAIACAMVSAIFARIFLSAWLRLVDRL